MIGTLDPATATPLVCVLATVAPCGATRSQTGVALLPLVPEPLAAALATVTLKGIIPPFVETSSSLAARFQAAPVVYVNDSVSGVEPDAGVKFAVVAPGDTTKVAGGFEMESVTGMLIAPIFGTVLIERVALRDPGGKPVGFAITVTASGACPELGATVSQPAWLGGVPGG